MKKKPKSRAQAASSSKLPRPSEVFSKRFSSLPKGLKIALFVSVLLLAARFWFATRLGFTDAEALYASYGLFPQPGYVDQPGLIGNLASWLGDGLAPNPIKAHTFSATVTTLLPWLGVWTLKQLGVSLERAVIPAWALLLLPEFSVGLFGFTPQLLLIPIWLFTIGAAAGALSAKVGSTRAVVYSLLTAVGIGFGTLAHLSMLPLALALVLVWAGPSGRPHLKSLAPWAGLITIGILTWPLATWKSANPSQWLGHNLFEAGNISAALLSNLLFLGGGLLLLITPPLLYGAYRVLRALRPGPTANHQLIFFAVWVPLLTLLPSSLLSESGSLVGFGPVLVGLCLGWGQLGLEAGRSLSYAAIASSGLVTLIAALWVSTDLPVKILGDKYQGRFDIANDMRAWQSASRLVVDALSPNPLKGLPVPALKPANSGGQTPTVIGPNWSICAQLQANLQRQAKVGCSSTELNDFSSWHPPEVWQTEGKLVFVTDDRFPVDLKQLFPNRKTTSHQRTRVIRGGREVRQVEVSVLELESSVAGLSLHAPHSSKP